MSLSDLASLGSFISGIAVLFSFIFLALQLRQLNLNQRSSMQQARNEKAIEIYLKMSEPQISEIAVRAYRGDNTMESQQILSFYSLWGAWFRLYENNFLQHRAGTLDAARWDTDVAAMKYLFGSPAVRSAWRSERLIIGCGAFRDVVDKLMHDTKVVAEALDYSRIWKKRLSDELKA